MPSTEWIPVELSQPLIQFADVLSKLRNAKSAILGADTFNNMTGNDSHRIGLYGEIAVGHYYNVPIDIMIYDDHGDRINGDLEVRGKQVEVKTSTYVDDPYLRVKEYEHRDDMIYILCAVELPVVYLCGWATAEEVQAVEPRRLRADGPINYVVEHTNLRLFTKGGTP